MIVPAYDGSNDWVRRENERGRVSYVVDKEHIARSRSADRKEG
jgi:hypothetical protein